MQRRGNRTGERKVHLDIRKNFFKEKTVKHAFLGKLRKVLESPCLWVFKRCVDVVLREMV